jgi:condensin complex subunit 3
MPPKRGTRAAAKSGARAKASAASKKTTADNKKTAAPEQAEAKPTAKLAALQRRVGAAFDDAQRNLQRHARATRTLCALRTGKGASVKAKKGAQTSAESDDADLDKRCEAAATFDEVFLSFVNRVLAVGKREASVERLVTFIAQLAVNPEMQLWKTAEAPTDAEQEQVLELAHDHLAKVLIRQLLPVTDVKDDAVRFRSIQLLAGIIEGLDEQFDLDDEWDEIERRGLARLRDSKPHIRQYAVHALARLQDPTDVDSSVTREYLRLLSTESSNDVRKAVLSSIGLSKITLEEIVGRTRDVKDDLRRHAFVILATKVHVKVLTITQRMQLLRDGLNDRNERVRQACIDMVVNGWLPAREMDAVSLLQKLDVGVSDAVGDDGNGESTVIIEDMFKAILPLVERKLSNAGVDLTALGPETVMYWRCHALHVHETARSPAEAYEKLDGLLPSITDFCEVVAAYAEGDVSEDSNNNQDVASFVLLQLLKLISLMDLSDEAGRESLANLLPKLLIFCGPSTAVSDSCARLMLKILEKVTNSTEDLLQLELDMMTELQREHEVADNGGISEDLAEALPELRENIAELETQQRELEDQGLVAEAQPLKDIALRLRGELQEIEDALSAQAQLAAGNEDFGESADRALRSLTIVEAALSLTSGAAIEDHAKEALRSTILATHQNHAEDDVLRHAIFRNLGTFCLADASAAAQYHSLFISAAQHDTSADVRLSAIQCLFDITLVHWHRWCSPGPDKEDKRATIAAMIDTLLSIDGEDVEVDDLLLHGFAKILLAGTPLCSSDTSSSPNQGRAVALELAETHAEESNHGMRAALLARLFNFYFDAVESRERPATTQCLSVFFPLFAFGGGDVNRVCIRDAFVPALHCLQRSMAEADDMPAKTAAETLEGAVRFFFHLTDTEQVRAHQREQSRRTRGPDFFVEPIHGDLAFAMAFEALAAPSTTQCKTMARLLSQATPAARIVSMSQLGSDVRSAREWPVVLDKLEAAFSDKTSERAISTFAKGVESQLASITLSCDQEDEEGHDCADHSEAALRKSLASDLHSFQRLRTANTRAARKRPARKVSIGDESFEADVATPTREELPLRAPSTRIRRTRTTNLVDSDSEEFDDESSADSDILDAHSPAPGPSTPMMGKLQLSPVVAPTFDSDTSEDEGSLSDSEAEELAVNRSTNSSIHSARSAFSNTSLNLSSQDTDSAAEKNAKLIQFFAGVAQKQGGRDQKRQRVSKGSASENQENRGNKSTRPVKAIAKKPGRPARKPKRALVESDSSSDESPAEDAEAAKAHLAEIDSLLYD